MSNIALSENQPNLESELPTAADRWAIFLSAVCMIHCLATPLLLMAFPFVHELPNEALIHSLFIFPLVAFAVWAFWRGYKIHGRKTAMVLGLIGFFALLTGLALHDHTGLIPATGLPHAGLSFDEHQGMHIFGVHLGWASVVTSIGSIFLIAAHFFNMRYCRCACHRH